MRSTSWQDSKEAFGKDIIQDLYHQGMIRTWYRDNPDGWTLVSGLWSPLYIQLRSLPSYPAILKKVGRALGQLVRHEISSATTCIGIAMAGIPIATAIALHEGIPVGFTRKLDGVRNLTEFRRNIARYGEHALVEGFFGDGDTIVLIDDLVTQFDSKLIAIEQVKIELLKRHVKNSTVADVVVLLDREQGAERRATNYGIKLHSLIPFKTKGLPWLSEFLDAEEYDVLADYLAHPKKFQTQTKQGELRKLARTRRKNTRRTNKE